MTGRLLVLAKDGTLWQLAPGPGGRTTHTAVAHGIPEDVTVSPDRTRLAYVRGGTLVVRTVATGAERSIATHVGTDCLKWAPDSRHLSVLSDHDLAVVDLSGHRTVLDRVKTADYEYLPGWTVRVTSQLGCQGWLDSSRLVFNRVRALPKSISRSWMDSTKKTYALPADTVTVGTVRGQLSDTRPVWQLLSSCGHWAYTDAGSDSGKLYLVDTTHLPPLNTPSPLTPAGAQVDVEYDSLMIADFIPGSCRPILVQQVDSSQSGAEIHAVDPDTRTLSTRPLAVETGDLEGLYPHAGAWSPEPGVTRFAQVNLDRVELVDLNSGGIGALATTGITDPTLLVAWLP